MADQESRGVIPPYFSINDSEPSDDSSDNPADDPSDNSMEDVRNVTARAGSEDGSNKSETDGSEYSQEEDACIITREKAPGACNFPQCPESRAEIARRKCTVCGTEGMHHHLCAIDAGQEGLSTMCYSCALPTLPTQTSWTDLKEAEGVRLLKNNLAKSPVLGSPPGTDEANDDNKDSSDELELHNAMISSPNRYAQMGRVLPVAGTPKSRAIWGYCSGILKPQKPDGRCFFHSARGAAVVMHGSGIISEETVGFFGASTDALKENIRAFLTSLPAAAFQSLVAAKRPIGGHLPLVALVASEYEYVWIDRPRERRLNFQHHIQHLLNSSTCNYVSVNRAHRHSGRNR